MSSEGSTPLQTKLRRAGRSVHGSGRGSDTPAVEASLRGRAPTPQALPARLLMRAAGIRSAPHDPDADRLAAGPPRAS